MLKKGKKGNVILIRSDTKFVVFLNVPNEYLERFKDNISNLKDFLEEKPWEVIKELPNVILAKITKKELLVAKQYDKTIKKEYIYKEHTNNKLLVKIRQRYIREYYCTVITYFDGSSEVKNNSTKSYDWVDHNSNPEITFLPQFEEIASEVSRILECSKETIKSFWKALVQHRQVYLLEFEQVAQMLVSGIKRFLPVANAKRKNLWLDYDGYIQTDDVITADDVLYAIRCVLESHGYLKVLTNARLYPTRHPLSLSENKWFFEMPQYIRWSKTGKLVMTTVEIKAREEVITLTLPVLPEQIKVKSVEIYRRSERQMVYHPASNDGYRPEGYYETYVPVYQPIRYEVSMSTKEIKPTMTELFDILNKFKNISAKGKIVEIKRRIRVEVVINED